MRIEIELDTERFHLRTRVSVSCRIIFRNTFSLMDKQQSPLLSHHAPISPHRQSHYRRDEFTGLIFFRAGSRRLRSCVAESTRRSSVAKPVPVSLLLRERSDSRRLQLRNWSNRNRWVLNKNLRPLWQGKSLRRSSARLVLTSNSMSYRKPADNAGVQKNAAAQTSARAVEGDSRAPSELSDYINAPSAVIRAGSTQK